MTDHTDHLETASTASTPEPPPATAPPDGAADEPTPTIQAEPLVSGQALRMGTGAPSPAAGRPVFIAPQTIDRVAFDELMRTLSARIADAERTMHALRQAAEDAEHNRAAAREDIAKQKGYINMVSRLLKAIEEQTGRIDEQVERCLSGAQERANAQAESVGASLGARAAEAIEAIDAASADLAQRLRDELEAELAQRLEQLRVVSGALERAQYEHAGHLGERLEQRADQQASQLIEQRIMAAAEQEQRTLCARAEEIGNDLRAQAGAIGVGLRDQTSAATLALREQAERAQQSVAEAAAERVQAARDELEALARAGEQRVGRAGDRAVSVLREQVAQLSESAHEAVDAQVKASEARLTRAIDEGAMRLEALVGERRSEFEAWIEGLGVPERLMSRIEQRIAALGTGLMDRVERLIEQRTQQAVAQIDAALDAAMEAVLANATQRLLADQPVPATAGAAVASHDEAIIGDAGADLLLVEPVIAGRDLGAAADEPGIVGEVGEPRTAVAALIEADLVEEATVEAEAGELAVDPVLEAIERLRGSVLGDLERLASALAAARGGPIGGGPVQLVGSPMPSKSHAA